MGKKVECAGNCGKIINTGLFASDIYFVIDGKIYCKECREKMPKHLGKECFQCAYYGVNENYNGFCKKFNNKYVDRYKKACEDYER